LLEKGVKTFILGGEVKAVTEAIVGSSAVDDLKKYNFSKGFLGQMV
ncbi:Lactose phosphotransferase system repressor, partial [human gut metagenome]